MKWFFLTRNLQRIARFAQANGTIAIIDGDAVTVFVPILQQLGNGMRSVNFRVDRIQSMEEAHQVLDMAMAQRHASFM